MVALFAGNRRDGSPDRARSGTSGIRAIILGIRMREIAIGFNVLAE
jgi:hypothetical protein